MLRISLEERKAYIARTAMDIFLEKGYKSASLQDIAGRVEITKAGIYHYFKAKEEILAYILIELHAEALEKLKRVDLSQNGTLASPPDILRHVIRSYAHVSLSTKNLSLLAVRERHQLTGKYQKQYREKEKAIYKVLKDKISAVPQIKAHYDINAIVFLIISMCAWFGYWLKTDGKLRQEEVIEQGVEIICSGMIAK